MCTMGRTEVTRPHPLVLQLLESEDAQGAQCERVGDVGYCSRKICMLALVWKDCNNHIVLLTVHTAAMDEHEVYWYRGSYGILLADDSKVQDVVWEDFLLPVQSHNHKHFDCPPCFRGKTTQKVLQLELSWGLLDWSWPFEEKDRDALSCDSKVDIGVVAECCDADSRQQEEMPLVLQAESERIQGPTANVGLCTYNCF